MQVAASSPSSLGTAAAAAAGVLAGAVGVAEAAGVQSAAGMTILTMALMGMTVAALVAGMGLLLVSSLRPTRCTPSHPMMARTRPAHVQAAWQACHPGVLAAAVLCQVQQVAVVVVVVHRLRLGCLALSAAASVGCWHHSLEGEQSSLRDIFIP